MSTPVALAAAHLLLRLRPLNRALRTAAERQTAAAERLTRPDLSAFCVTGESVQMLLNQLDDARVGDTVEFGPSFLSADEQLLEEDLREQAGALGTSLPLDQLAAAAALTDFEQDALLLCAAVELDRSYERIYAFILDDLNRRYPCLELLISLTCGSVEQRIERRHTLAGVGRLRRHGILMPFGDAPTELRREFRLAPGVFDCLTGAPADLSLLCRDRAEVMVPAGIEPPPQVSQQQFAHLIEGFTECRLSVLGIWGPRRNGAEEFVLALAAAMGRPLRRVSVLDFERPGADPAKVLDEQMRVASGLAAVVWLKSDSIAEPAHERLRHLLAEAFSSAAFPVLITGEHPWRPDPFLQSGRYAELELAEPLYQAREKLWSRSFPELDPAEVESLAARYRLSGVEIRSVSELARTRARLAGNGQPPSLKDHVAPACSVVTLRSSSHLAVVVHPKRGPRDLILPENLHRQIVEVARFFRLRSRVDEEWGFGRMASGSGMKALFTGDPGTGKTLAAEVIAGLLDLPLYKVDLARIVSKWVGETEKNLESAFREAEESHSVLFFDEAEALFGKRAEVQHGTDRYANLEVSYLLQRLESARGLVILASNVKDQIDPAFIRRFQVAIHFPRPGIAERRRLWQLALPSTAPLDAELDLDALARLDMTGAAIVSAARTAALLVADSGAATISMEPVVNAIARQFRREARLLTPAELGPYGALLPRTA
jgi:hypothetical protein